MKKRRMKMTKLKTMTPTTTMMMTTMNQNQMIHHQKEGVNNYRNSYDDLIETRERLKRS